MGKTRRTRLFLSEIGNRRSRTARIATGAALAATLFGSMRIGWATTGPTRVTPPATTSAAGAAAQRVRPVTLEDLSGKVPSDALWKLFDGDAATGLAGQGDVRIQMTFSEPVAVTAVGGFGARDGRLVLHGATGAAGGETVAAAGTAWTRVDAKSADAARTFVVEWAPGGPNAALSELEVWGRFEGEGRAPARPLADALFDPSSAPAGTEVFAAPAETRVISVATAPAKHAFTVDVPRDPRSSERAFLAYELDGLSHYTSAVRRLNGASPVGGFAASLGAKGGQQVEEISPAALRSGANVVEFLPVSTSAPGGYRVGNVKLIVTHVGDTEARDAGEDIAVANELGDWQQPNGSIRHLRFAAPHQLHELRLQVTERQSGKLVLAAASAANRHSKTIDLGVLGAGSQVIPLDGFPIVDEVTLGFEGAGGKALYFADLAVTGSPIPSSAAPLRVTYPLHGECVNHQVHVRALTPAHPTALRAGGTAVAQSTWEPGAFSFTASEKDLGGGQGEPFSFRLEATVAGQALATSIPIAGCVDRPTEVAGPDGPVHPREDVGAPYGVVLKAKRATKLAFAGLELDVPAGAVEKDVRVTVRPLSPEEVPAMEEGMTNVTAGARAFRLGPHGMVFKKPVALSIPIDPSRVTPGETAHAFYFDEATKKWSEVPVVGAGRAQVAARTTHFTDFIASTLALPEHPGLQSLDPTSLKNIKVADPSAGLAQISPPAANPDGTANLSYPIEVPPGRLGMQPHLAITYDSSRGNGWLGTGWDLSVSSIEIDTRWGVPRYDGTERYMIDGEALTPAAPAGAPAGGTYFARRREGKFDWIQRLGTATTGFSWLVTDKAGTKYIYGAADNAQLAPRNGSTVNHLKVYKWLLQTAEDINGNQVNYTYTPATGNNGDPWVQIYLTSIAYTASSAGGPAPAYSVVFNQQSGTRADAFTTGRPGFQVLTNQLLGSIDVKDGTTIVRHYALTYTTGDFGKTLLHKISQLGKGGTGNSIGDHVFTYNTTPVGSTGTPQIFGSPTSQGVPYTTLSDPNDYVTSPGDPVDYHGLADQQNTNNSQQATVFVAGGGQTHTWTKGVAGFEDMNGDGLPDYLPFSNTGSQNGLAQAISVSGPNVVGTVMNQQSFTGLTTPYSEEDADYMTSSYNFIIASGSQDYGDIMQGRTLHTDINGDGLPDIVTGAQNSQLQVQLNQGQFKGFAPAFAMGGYQATGLGFDCSDIWTDNGDTPPTVPPTGNQVPSADVITRWVAPYTGQVQINGQMQRQGSGTDPLVASLYIVNHASAPTGTMIWQHTVNSGDAACTPVDGGLGILGTVCNPSNTTGYFRTVNAGDRIYTRVGAVTHANQDGLLWNTTITYTTASSPASEANSREAWGPYRYKWSEQTDEEMAGAYYKPWTAAFAGSVQLQVQVDKGNTADNVAVLAWLYTPSNGNATFIGSAHYNATTIVDPNSTAPLTFQTANVNPDDQIHVFVQSDTPIDPGTIKVLTLANYTTLCRPNPYAGGTYCGTPVCTAHTDDGGSDCVLNGAAGTTDPQVGSPLSGSQVSQIVPTYDPLQRWVYQATTTPNPPTTSLDGRTGVFTHGTQQPQICYQNTNLQNTSNQAVTVMVQTTPGQLLTKYVQPLTTTSDVNLCTPLPAVGNNTQVVFSVYYDPSAYSGAPLPSWVNGTFTANLISGSTKTPVPVEFYVRDTTYPQLTTFPFFGGVENMASGYHNFNMGLWNGNASFDESFVAGQTTNANYAPMIQAPMPVPSSTGGGSGTNSFLGLGSIVSFLEDVVGAIASFAEYVWDNVTHLLSVFGSILIQAVRWIGSILGKVFTWAMCEIEGVGYTADGIRLTENHNKQEGAGVIAGVGRSHGFSLSGLDLVDMNGDRYPDQVSTQGIRYAYFDPTTNTGQFCTTPATSATCSTSGKPQVSFPQSYIRDVRHAMHSYNFGVSLGGIADAVVTRATGTETNGVEPGVAESTDASQGYSRTNRDLIDINGDGLPDIVDVGSIACSPQATRGDLCVQLNYGYGFSAPIWWKSSAWSRDAGSIASTVPTLLNSELAQDLGSIVQQGLNLVGDSVNTYDPPTSQTIRLEEEGHKGGQVSIGPFGGGSDDSYTRRLIDLVDVNGDGLPDQIMKLPGDSYRIKLNTGSGFGAEIASDAIAWPAANVWFSDSSVSVTSTDTLEFTRNYTSDDSNDYGLYGDSSGNGSRQTLIELMDIDGDGRLDQVMKNVLFTGPNDPSATQVWARLNQVGTSNLLSGVTLPLGGNFQISYSRTGNFVGTQQFPWGESVNADMQEARWTMSECLTNDGRGNQVETLFSYSLGYFDRTEREFFGFAQVETDHGSRGQGGGINGDGSYEMQFFHNQNYYERGMPYADYTVEVFGAVEHGTVYNRILAATPNATNSEYVQTEKRMDQPFDKTVLFFSINPTLVFEEMFPLSGSPVSHYTLHSWDTNGNLTLFLDYGDLTSSADDVVYNLTYTTYPNVTHLTALTHIDERMAGPQTLLAQREATYTVTNNRPQVTQIRDLVIGGGQPVSGSPYTGTSTQVQTYNLTYNTADLGNVGTFTDPTGYKLTYTYDAATKTHVTGVSDTFSLTSSRTMNQDYGLPATTTDVNGKIVTYNYDTYGRLNKVWSPVDPTTGQATIQMTYSQGGATAATPWAMTQHKDFESTTGTTIDTVAFADGLGRVIQTKKKAALLQSNGTTVNGYDITGLIVWDANGRVMAQSQPFFDSATAETTLVPAVSKNPTVYTYDGLNRVTSSTTADGAMTQTVYTALLSSPEDPGDPLPGFSGQLSLERITDANENTTRVYRDGAGRILFNMDAENNVTTYGYDVLNNLSAVTDANDNVTTGTYDSLSRLVSLSSPDTGETDWRYALSGLLQEKQTANLRAKSQLIKYGYTTNRLTTITYPTMPVVTYTYGTSAQAGSTFGNIAGRVASMMMEGGTESRQYDAFGNISQTTTTLHHINNATLTSPVVTMKYAYDWLGRTETMTFPKVVDNSWNIATGDGEVTTYTYDSGGRLKTITGKTTPTSTAETYLSSIGYDEFGTRKNLVSGNGITTAYTYEPAQHRLSAVTASGKAASGATVQFLNIAYGYDPVGNVLTVNNNIANSAIQPNSATVGIGPLSITNTYDADNRLSSSSGTYRGHSTSGQAYSTMFLYNGIDNITSKSQVDSPLTFAAGASGLANPTFGTALTGTSYTLHYSYTTGKVHQPGTIFDINSVGTQSTRTENFDADGNNTGDSVPASNTRVLTWDETDRLKSVTLNGGVVARYQYTPGGERTQKQDAVGGTTSFYFNQFLVINGSKQMTKSLFAGATRIASKTESAQLTTPVRSFYHPDNVGSTSYISNAGQTLVQHERYFPTGERWSSPSEVVTINNIQRDYLFTGKELDRDTGFYYFGARYLDPRTSNWLSTDPILGSYMERGAKAALPENMSLYAYAWNNPMVMRDPTGLSPCNGQCVMNPAYVVGDPHANMRRPVPASRPINQGPRTTNLTGFSLPVRTADTSKAFPLILGGAAGGGAALILGPEVALGVGKFAAMHPNLVGIGTSIAAGEGGNMIGATENAAVRFGEDDLVLGLNRLGSLKEWAAKMGGRTFGEFDLPSGSFDKQIRSAMNQASAIRFNLSGVDASLANGALSEFGEPLSGYTNYELHLLQTTPQYLSKTTFYNGGVQVPSPF